MDKQTLEKVWDNLTALGDSLSDLTGTGAARKHFVASRREALLGFSALLERAAGCREHAGETQASPAASGRSIEITE